MTSSSITSNSILIFLFFFYYLPALQSTLSAMQVIITICRQSKTTLISFQKIVVVKTEFKMREKFLAIHSLTKYVIDYIYVQFMHVNVKLTK